MSYVPFRFIVLVWVINQWEVFMQTNDYEKANTLYEYHLTHGENFIRNIEPIFIDTDHPDG